MCDTVAPLWARRAIGELFQLQSEAVLPTSYPRELFEHYSIPAFDEFGGPALDLGKSIASNKTLLPNPTLLVSKLNPRISRVVLIGGKGQLRRCASTEWMPFVALSGDVDLPFFKWLFSSSNFQRRLQRVATGSTNSHVRVHPSEILQWHVAVPILPEQRRIAAILDTVDDTIRRTEQVIAKLQRMKQGLLHDLLTRGVDEHGDLRPTPEEAPHLYRDSPLGRVPAAWDTTHLCEISTFITSGSRGWAAFYSHAGALFLRIANLTREHINLRFDSTVFVRPPATSEGKRTAVKPGDLLISITADLGAIGVVPNGLGEAYVNQHIALVRLDGSKVSSRWIAQYLAGSAGRRQFRRLNDMGAKAGLNLPTVGNLLVALPSPSEQHALAAVIDSIDQSIRREEILGEKLHAEKHGLQQDLLTGRVRVPLPAEATA